MAAYDLEAIKSLIQQQKFDQAYEQASAYLDEMAGDPTYDFYYGLVAIDSGHVNQGIFAFERILMLQPGHLRARLELGRAYFLLGEDARSRKEFQQVLDSNPPAQVAENVSKFLDRIRLRERRYSTSASGYIEVGVGYDSNVNSATSENALTFFGIPLTLDPSSLEISDQFAFTSVGAQINHPIASGTALFGGVDASKRFYNTEEAAENSFVNLQVGESWLRGRNNYSLSLAQLKFYVNDEAYSETSSLIVDVSHLMSEAMRLSAGFRISELDYETQSTREADQYALNFKASRLFKGKFAPMLDAGLQLGRADAKQDAHEDIAERDFYALALSSRLILAPTVSANISVGVQNSEYGAVQEAFGVVRNDDIYLAGLDLIKLGGKAWSLNARYSYIRNDSNITLYDYERHQYQLSVRREFR